MSLSTETLAPEITLTPFRAADALAMDPTIQTIQAFTGVDPLQTFRLYETGPGWTLRIGETIIGCAGLMFPWAPVRTLAIAWLLPSPHLPRYPLTATKALLGTLRDLMDVHQPTRIEFFVSAAFPPAQRFAEFLDFRRDGCCDPPCARCGLVRAYGPRGEDYIRYVWTREP